MKIFMETLFLAETEAVVNLHSGLRRLEQLITLKTIERRTSNVQHRTSNVDSLCSVLFKLTEYIIRCWTLNVQCSMFIFLLILKL
jgi:hypothetical protein